MHNRDERTHEADMSSTPRIAEFIVRPGFDAAARPLIEFLGDHRAPDFPSVLVALQDQLRAFEADGTRPIPDDIVWQCRFDGGTFELCEDWASLFIHADVDADRIIETVAAALVRSGHFHRRASTAPSGPLLPDGSPARAM